MYWFTCLRWQIFLNKLNAVTYFILARASRYNQQLSDPALVSYTTTFQFEEILDCTDGRTTGLRELD